MPPSGPAPSSSASAPAHVADERRIEAPAERGGERELIPVLDAQLLAERLRRARLCAADARVAAQELVRGGELGADACGLMAGVLRGALGGRQCLARALGLLIGERAARTRTLELCLERAQRRALTLELPLQLDQLGRELLLAARVDLSKLGLERGDPIGARQLDRAVAGLRRRAQRLQLEADALDPPAQRLRADRDLLGAQAQPLMRRAGLIDAARERVVALTALGERALGPASAVDRLLQPRLDLAAPAPRLGDALLGAGELHAAGRGAVARELQARLQDLQLEALVQLGRFGLALERAQPRARLTLDVERAIEVLLRTLELQLRAPPALAVLAEPRRLLDQQSPLTRLRGHDRVHAPLRDDRMRLLAEPGVGEHVDHIAQAAARAVEAVAALAVAVEVAHDRDLAERQIDGAVGVVEHDLNLGCAARLHAAAAAEDHILHRLPAHRQRRLLAHRPQHGVGDVRLARPVRADDDADARPEVQAGAIGERLEAVQRE